MILINRPDVDPIAIEYADSLCRQFIDKRKTIDDLLDILLTTKKYNVEDLHINKSLAALKLILNLDKLEAPKKLSGKKNTDILQHNIDKNRIKTDKRSKCRKQIKYLEIRNQLNLIFNTDLKDLFSAKATELKALNEQFDPYNKLKIKVYNYFFDYQKYYKTLNRYIGEELGIICCPYCNRNYISYVFSKRQKRIIGPTYDHFFNKGKYKFLALSFYNLIPSCYVCNSNLKNQINFDLKTHLYPYTDEFGKDAKFDFELILVGQGIQKKITFKPKIIIAPGTSVENIMKLTGKLKDIKGEVTGSIKVFKLNEIYETHHDTVEEVHEKFDENSPYYVKSIKDNLKKLGVTEDEFYRYHFHNYFDSGDFHKRPLSKLTKDIYEKMKEIQISNDTSK